MQFDAATSVDDFNDSTESCAEEEVDITILSHEVGAHLPEIVPKKANTISYNIRSF